MKSYLWGFLIGSTPAMLLCLTDAPLNGVIGVGIFGVMIGEIVGIAIGNAIAPREEDKQV